jgi:protein involved in polysaccharide export with SLBB domain
VGRVAIDVPRAIADERSPDNLQLLDGDSILVPQRSFTVQVAGAVNAPTVVAYVAGQSLDYYISQAGGLAKLADGHRAYVTQPNGKRETRGHFRTPTPLPGSSVVVPTKDATGGIPWATALAAAAPVIASLVTLIVALRR